MPRSVDSIADRMAMIAAIAAGLLVTPFAFLGEVICGMCSEIVSACRKPGQDCPYRTRNNR